MAQCCKSPSADSPDAPDPGQPTPPASYTSLADVLTGTVPSELGPSPDDDGARCAVCLEPSVGVGSLRMACCGHHLHTHCFVQWLVAGKDVLSCVYCKAPIRSLDAARPLPTALGCLAADAPKAASANRLLSLYGRRGLPVHDVATDVRLDVGEPGASQPTPPADTPAHAVLAVVLGAVLLGGTAAAMLAHLVPPPP